MAIEQIGWTLVPQVIDSTRFSPSATPMLFLQTRSKRNVLCCNGVWVGYTPRPRWRMWKGQRQIIFTQEGGRFARETMSSSDIWVNIAPLLLRFGLFVYGHDTRIHIYENLQVIVDIFAKHPSNIPCEENGNCIVPRMVTAIHTTSVRMVSAQWEWYRQGENDICIV